MKNTEELANPNVDLRYEKEKTYSYRFTAEGRRRLSGPSQGDAAAGLMKIRGATAAAVAELGQRSDGARRKKRA